MGRVIQADVVGVRCELATQRGRHWKQRPSCTQLAPFPPIPVNRPDLEYPALRTLVGLGWAFVMNTPLRAYCAEHAERARQCSCRYRHSPSRTCPAHSDSRALVWTSEVIPDDINSFLTRYDSQRSDA